MADGGAISGGVGHACCCRRRCNPGFRCWRAGAVWAKQASPWPLDFSSHFTQKGAFGGARIVSKLTSFLEGHGLKRKRRRSAVVLPERRMTQILHERCVIEGADFAAPHMENALLFDDHQQIRNYAIEKVAKSGFLLEFGVFDGTSINHFAGRLSSSGDTRSIFGFDAFLGLQENWTGTGFQARGRQFNRDGVVPKVRQNVNLIKGWIEDTLPTFLKQHQGPIAFIHIDTDTYTPCKAILTLCKDRLVSGSVILFDELLCYPGWRFGEYKALNEVLDPDRYTWAAFEEQRAALVIN
ncbi:class I SAM-dependent methyltransferase [Mesorhizobium sp. B283B1A]|uniref:class I SAM-dependent methyltransferase n=1 Tax=Mesorhizobium TaxID=68287 RepID=UPI001CD122D4|nr:MULTISPECIES: class I SAM-dependent methyltransferase [Mesorhizobium]MCA0047423.1 class I SAM-dependent methyltransferase [Mesorhizobium sp. B283B1A]UQS63262.1 class I SAM-dependent methyltransferase [Mesorhizobium opportunistum]